jgi:hypothetical protein
VPLLLLHGRQIGRRFAGQLLPSCDSGLAWSVAVATSRHSQQRSCHIAHRAAISSTLAWPRAPDRRLRRASSDILRGVAHGSIVEGTAGSQHEPPGDGRPDPPRFGIMKALKPEEEWARGIISQTLSVPVEQHDDGSRDGMHDLWILYPDRPAAAAEITAAADAESMRLSRLISDKGRWLVPGLRGGWFVWVDPSRLPKRLFKELLALLFDLEEAGETYVDVEPENAAGRRWDARAHDLGITSLRQGDTDYPGSVYVEPDVPRERSAGFVAPTGDAIAAWIGDFLRLDRPRVLPKLARSGASERHAFVLVPLFATAPFGVSELLMGSQTRMPIAQPQLPVETTHVWVVGTAYDVAGFYWAPDSGWSSFRTPPAPLLDTDR